MPSTSSIAEPITFQVGDSTLTSLSPQEATKEKISKLNLLVTVRGKTRTVTVDFNKAKQFLISAGIGTGTSLLDVSGLSKDEIKHILETVHEFGKINYEQLAHIVNQIASKKTSPIGKFEPTVGQKLSIAGSITSEKATQIAKEVESVLSKFFIKTGIAWTLNKIGDFCNFLTTSVQKILPRAPELHFNPKNGSFEIVSTKIDKNTGEVVKTKKRTLFTLDKSQINETLKQPSKFVKWLTLQYVKQCDLSGEEKHMIKRYLVKKDEEQGIHFEYEFVGAPLGESETGLFPAEEPKGYTAPSGFQDDKGVPVSSSGFPSKDALPSTLPRGLLFPEEETSIKRKMTIVPQPPAAQPTPGPKKPAGMTAKQWQKVKPRHTPHLTQEIKKSQAHDRMIEEKQRVPENPLGGRELS